jgi:hypothetical protein
MRFRKLRIAWSVFWGLVAVLLIVLSVRSFWCGYDLIASDAKNGFVLFAERGVIGVTSPGLPRWSRTELIPETFIPGKRAHYKAPGFTGFYVGSDPTGPTYLLIQIPLWFVVLFVTAVSALPSIRWSKRFTLRTLLIATTLVAVVLGLVVWAARQ